MLYEEIELYLNLDMLQRTDLSSEHRFKLERANEKHRIDIKNLRKANMRQILNDFILNISALSILAFIVFPIMAIGFMSGLILKIMPKKEKEFKGVLRIK